MVGYRHGRKIPAPYRIDPNRPLGTQPPLAQGWSWSISVAENEPGGPCGAWQMFGLREQKKLHGHEVWKFTEKPRSGIATLIKVNTICTVCHSLQHWGRTSFLIMAGVMSVADGERLIRHFMKVNGCTKAAFKRHSDRASAVWRARSKKKWKIDWGEFKPAVDEAEASRKRWHNSRRRSFKPTLSAFQEIRLSRSAPIG
jgi:hypothetical protein